MKKRQTTFALLALGFICFIGFAMVSPPPGGNPILPSTPYQYQPDEYPNFVTLNAPIRNITDEKATLGRVLFYDTRLSKNDELSCGSCHVQEKSFADTDQFSTGINDILTTRNTPGLNDLGWVQNFGLFWDFRTTSLHDLVIEPILNENELDGSIDLLFERLNDTEFYPKLFQDAYGDDEPTEDRIAEALAAFISSMATFNSDYDKWYRGEAALSQAAIKGKNIFEEDCATCHSMNSFHSNWMTTNFNNGLDEVYEDLGMASWDDNAAVGIFRSPSLRNIEFSAPYMHDGRLETLEDVIDFYSEEIKQNSGSFFLVTGGWGTPSEPFTGFDYSDTEKQELLAFLKSLSDTDFTTDKKFSNPFPSTISTGQEEITLLEGVSLFPNPISEEATLTYPNAAARIFVYDMHGRLVFTDDAQNGNYTLKRQQLSRGMYNLMIESEGKRHTQKIIFQ